MLFMNVECRSLFLSSCVRACLLAVKSGVLDGGWDNNQKAKRGETKN